MHMQHVSCSICIPAFPGNTARKRVEECPVFLLSVLYFSCLPHRDRLTYLLSPLEQLPNNLQIFSINIPNNML